MMRKTMSILILISLINFCRGHTDGRSSDQLVCENDSPLGLTSGGIADWQITASSTYPANWVKGCSERNARLYLPNGLAWCAKFKSSSEWIQVDLGVEAIVTGIMTQGRGDGSEWVTSYMISYSNDGVNWMFITDQYGSQKIFEGNSDSFMVKHNYLDEPIRARHLKLHTYTWNNHPSIRLELVGCQPCKQLLGVPPYARYAASSTRGKRIQRSCMAEYGHYLSNKAWCAKRQDTICTQFSTHAKIEYDAQQWLQIDIGPPTKVTGAIIRGRGDNKRPQFVSRFKLSYSNDTRLWYFYKDAAPLDPRIFEGNTDQVNERIHYLASPFIARYVRIHPVQWHSRIAMRFGLIGCRQKGPCFSGFFRINNESSCVPNLAYKKAAWVKPEVKEEEDARTTENDPSPIKDRYQRDTGRQSDGVMLQQRHFGHPRSHSNGPTFSQLPYWSASGNIDTVSTTGDSMASLAVDGWTGDEDIAMQNNTATYIDRKMDRLMNDDPSALEAVGMDAVPHIHTLVGSTSDSKSAGRVCTKLEYRWPFVELPVWYVDLREQTEVNGLVIYTGQHGKGSSNPNSKAIEADKLNSDNLERLSVYVEAEPMSRNSGRTSSASSTLCGFITSLNGAIFKPRLHIPCRQPIAGRFVYIEAHGARGRWSPEFSALLCEVQVY